jgi:hypothetical protein
MAVSMETVTNTELYHDFCSQNNIRPYSFNTLAEVLNIPVNQLEFSIKGMILYYPDKFKQIHRRIGTVSRKR